MRAPTILLWMATCLCCGHHSTAADFNHNTQSGTKVRRLARSKVGSVCRIVVLLEPASLQASLNTVRGIVDKEDPSCALLAVYAAQSDEALTEHIEYATAVGDYGTTSARYFRAMNARMRTQKPFFMAWRLGSSTRVRWLWGEKTGQLETGAFLLEENTHFHGTGLRLLYWWLSDTASRPSMSVFFTTNKSVDKERLTEFSDTFRQSAGCLDTCIFSATFSEAPIIRSSSLFPLHSKLIVRELSPWESFASTREVWCTWVQGEDTKCTAVN